MTHIKSRQPKANSLLSTTKMLYTIHHCGRGLWVLVITLLGLAILAGINFEHRPNLYVAGVVAEHDAVADRDLLVEDVRATQLRREQLMHLQPMVYDLNYDVYATFFSKITELFKEVNSIAINEDYAAISQLMDTLTPAMAE